MLRAVMRELTESSPRYAGWQVTLAAFVGVMVSFAAMVPYTFSLFLTPLQDAFGWKREATSRGFAIAALTVAENISLAGFSLSVERVERLFESDRHSVFLDQMKC
jgi:hypothetical protein